MIEFQISGGTCNHEGKYKLMTLQGSIWHNRRQDDIMIDPVEHWWIDA